MRLIKLLFAALLIFSISLSAKEEQNSSKANLQKQKEEKYPIFTLKDIFGKSYKIKAVKWGLTFPGLKERAVAVLMFGKHCPPCLKEIPMLVELKKKYKGKFEILALQVQEKMNEKEAKAFYKAHNMNYVMIEGRDFMDFIYYFARKSGWKGMVPYILIFDKEGHIKYGKIGESSKEEIENAIKSILEPKKEAKKSSK